MKYRVSAKLIRIVVGAGRIFDFTNTYGQDLREKYLNTNSARLDRKAIMSDWSNVGKTIRTAMNKYKDSSDHIKHNHV